MKQLHVHVTKGLHKKVLDEVTYRKVNALPDDKCNSVMREALEAYFKMSRGERKALLKRE